MSKDAQTFQALLQADLENTSALLALMDQERSYLETRNLEAMNKLIMEKAQVLARIEKNDDLRRDLLKHANFPNSKQGIDNFILSLTGPGAASCSKDFEQLQVALRKCQEINTVNGIITNRSRKRTQQSMDIIRGITGQETVYTKQGSKDKDSNSKGRPISEA